MPVKRKRICVYCGSRTGKNPKFEALASEVGAEMVRQGWDLVYGGGSVGLMGRISRSVMQAGGEVYGVIPGGLFSREVADTEITELKVVGSMHERKAHMEKISDVFLALPGGWGTLDEFFEILTWAQIGIHQKPIAILNFENFFDPLLQQTELMVREGFIDPKFLSLVSVGETIPEVLGLLKQRLDQKFR